jgi:hypothetical protein
MQPSGKYKHKPKYHLPPVRAIIKKTKDTSAGEDVKTEISCTVGGNVNWYSHYGQQYGGSPKNEKQNYHVIYQSTTGSLYTSESQRHLPSHVCCSTIHNSQGMETTSVHQWMNGYRKCDT